MKKILPLMALVSSVACGDTNNYYVNGESTGENGSSNLDCEGAISRQVFECGYYKSSQQKDYDVGVRECKEVPFPQEYKDCIANSSCEEIRAGKCDPLVPNY